MHGGKAAETHKGNQNARKHGIYSDAIGEDEKALWDDIEIGNLDHAIKVAHLQLRRAMIAQQKAEAADGLDLDLESINTSEPGGELEEGGEPSEQSRRTTTVQRRRRPYEDIINRLLGRIGDLEAKRADIASKSGPAADMTGLLSDLIAKLPS
ncbi:MAG: hypothetical protein GX789_14390 [Pseudomonas formosensis]|nr:hypothetical protein [Halopseudomonas formosensis]